MHGEQKEAKFVMVLSSYEGCSFHSLGSAPTKVPSPTQMSFILLLVESSIGQEKQNYQQKSSCRLGSALKIRTKTLNLI